MSGAGRGSVEAEAGRGDPVALTRVLVATPSVNPSLSAGGQGEGEAARRAETWLGAWGFACRRTEVAPGRWNLVAELGDGPGPTLLLNGHLDTVGVEGVADPFDPVVRDGRIRGRGACDMKGGVGAILGAAAALARTGLPGGRLVVALTADEEHASVGMQALVDEGMRADAAVVCEPTGLAVMPAHKGFLWMDVVFRGRAAHGSRPEQGVDAIRHAGLYLSALEGLHARLQERSPHPLLGHGSFHTGTIRGGNAPSVYPAECRITLERRTLPGESADDAAAPFHEVLEELARREGRVDADLETGLFRPGTEVGTDHPLVEGLRQALRDEGVEPRVEGMTAWVDAAFLNEAGIPAVCLGPGSIALAHAADESVPVDEVRTCGAVLERYARSYLAGG